MLFSIWFSWWFNATSRYMLRDAAKCEPVIASTVNGVCRKVCHTCDTVSRYTLFSIDLTIHHSTLTQHDWMCLYIVSFVIMKRFAWWHVRVVCRSNSRESLPSNDWCIHPRTRNELLPRLHGQCEYYHFIQSCLILMNILQMLYIIILYNQNNILLAFCVKLVQFKYNSYTVNIITI